MATKIKAKNAAERHTKEMQAVISRSPSLVIQWGLSLVLLLLAFIGCMSFFIKSPDVLNTKIQIYSGKSLTGSPLYYGAMSINKSDINKLVIGQQATIQVQTFPFVNSETINGKVDSIAPGLSAGGYYFVRVILGPGNVSKLPLKDGITGTAQVKIGEVTLLKRITAGLFRFNTN